jgi:DNA repair protein RadC
LNALGKVSLSQLIQFKGIGEAKAISIIAALELGRRRRAEEVVELKKVTSSKIILKSCSLLGNYHMKNFGLFI